MTRSSLVVPGAKRVAQIANLGLRGSAADPHDQRREGRHRDRHFAPMRGRQCPQRFVDRMYAIGAAVRDWRR